MFGVKKLRAEVESLELRLYKLERNTSLCEAVDYCPGYKETPMTARDIDDRFNQLYEALNLRRVKIPSVGAHYQLKKDDNQPNNP